MQIPTLGNHSASLVSVVMQSFSKGAGSSSGGTGIYFHSVAAAHSAPNKLCMQDGLFQKSLPGQSLAFHLHLMATFLTFQPLQALSLGRSLFLGRAGGQGAVEGCCCCPRWCQGCSALKALCWWTHFSCTAALSSPSTTTEHQVTPTSCPCQRDSYARSTKGTCQSLACKQYINIEQCLDGKVFFKK